MFGWWGQYGCGGTHALCVAEGHRRDVLEGWVIALKGGVHLVCPGVLFPGSAELGSAELVVSFQFVRFQDPA